MFQFEHSHSDGAAWNYWLEGVVRSVLEYIMFMSIVSLTRTHGYQRSNTGTRRRERWNRSRSLCIFSRDSTFGGVEMGTFSPLWSVTHSIKTHTIIQECHDEDLTNASAEFDSEINRLRTNVIKIEDIGRAKLKSLKISPDFVAQLAFAAAFRELHGFSAPT